MAKTALLRPLDELFECSANVVESDVVVTEASKATEDAPGAPTGFLAKPNEVKARKGKS